jgi:ATP-binding cassette subfamily B protein
MIILDDCLSAVDTNTEQKIINYLNEALEDKTAIIITHRISSKISYDKIIVLERGQITEIGTHEELVKLKGYYYELLEKQKDWDEELKYS